MIWSRIIILILGFPVDVKSNVYHNQLCCNIAIADTMGHSSNRFQQSSSAAKSTVLMAGKIVS